MSIKKKISIKNAVLDFMEDTGIQSGTMEETLKRWARDAEIRIGSFTQYKRKIYVLDAEGCTVKLPCEAQAVLGTLMGDHGDCCDSLYDQVYRNQSNFNYSTSYLFSWDLFGGACVPRMKYEIQDNQLVFLNGSLMSDKVTCQLLVYDHDNDGYIKVNENHLNAITMYMEYKLARRWMYDPKRQNSRPVMNMDDTKKRWGMLCRDARATDGEPTETEKREIAAIHNDPYSGYGTALWQGGNNLYAAYL